MKKTRNIKSRGLVGNGPSGGFKAESFLSGGLSLRPRAAPASQIVASFERLCALSQEPDTKAPPWTRPAGLSPAGGFPLPGALPLRALMSAVYPPQCPLATSLDVR